MARSSMIYPILALSVAFSAALAGCGDEGPGPGPQVVTTAHCAYEPVAPTAGAGGTVSPGPLMAGTAEAALGMPVGTALGAYTGRARFLGTGTVDEREVELPGAFNASVGIETVPRVKALALSAGGETVVIVKLDIGLMYEGLLFDLEERLGPEHSGKVLLAASHSHSGWGQFSGHTGLTVGVGQLRHTVYQALLGQLEAVARAALDARRPARLGVFVDRAFDPGDAITRDRRGENDALMNGSRKDDTLVMIRVDGQDGVPMAAVPIFGMHGTINDADNSFASTDAPGAVERLLEEQFDVPVLVMHLQGAAGDVSPAGHGGLDCAIKPGDPADPCFEWLRAEGNGRAAAPVMMAAWQAAGASMQDELAMEMLTRSIELGPFPETFTIREGALWYAPFDLSRAADGRIWDDQGQIISPIDEFNAPVGAALCESDTALFPIAGIPGTDGLSPYGSCVRVDSAGEIFSSLMGVPFETSATQPICQSTRTVVSALRLADYVIGAVPGEPTVLAADLLRERSPVAADRTVVVGYAQGHIGYLLRPEDWLQGGYEPSIGFWGPLEAEYVLERLIELMPLAMTVEREDGASGGVDRVASPRGDDGLEVDDPAPMAGKIPVSVPAEAWLRAGTPASVQPAAEVARVSGLATFVWTGEDPLAGTPVVKLEREVLGVFEPVRRRSGRAVEDGDILLMYTPVPVVREGPQVHYWAVEWQPVPWLGARDELGAELDALVAPGSVPLGRYRFHVRGSGYELYSDAFAVVPAVLNVLAWKRNNMIGAEIKVAAPRGYRLLDMEQYSNRPLPLRGQPFTVELVTETGTIAYQADSNEFGEVSVDAPAAEVTAMRVTDAYGNTGESSEFVIYAR
jgi:neutral ceramidase